VLDLLAGCRIHADNARLDLSKREMKVVSRLRLRLIGGDYDQSIIYLSQRRRSFRQRIAVLPPLMDRIADPKKERAFGVVFRK